MIQRAMSAGERPDEYSDTPFGRQEWFLLQEVAIYIPMFQFLWLVRLADEPNHGHW